MSKPKWLTPAQEQLRSDALILTRLTIVLDILKSAGKATIRKINPMIVICHPANRGALGLNAFNSHRLGDRIITVGCRMEELDQTMVFEMSRKAAVRVEQMAFNQQLVDGSDGRLAPYRGC